MIWQSYRIILYVEVNASIVWSNCPWCRCWYHGADCKSKILFTFIKAWTTLSALHKNAITLLTIGETTHGTRQVPRNNRLSWCKPIIFSSATGLFYFPLMFLLNTFAGVVSTTGYVFDSLGGMLEFHNLTQNLSWIWWDGILLSHRDFEYPG
jgi:hypothetical protein